MRQFLARASLAVLITAAMASASAADTIWGIKSRGEGADASRTPASLFGFPPSGGFSHIGAVTLAGAEIDADALALSTTHGLLAYELQDPLAPTPSGSRLVRLETMTAIASPIGPVMTGREIRGAAFDLGDRLWVIDSLSDELLEINPANGAIIGTPLALSIPVGNICDIGVMIDGSLLLCDLNSIYTLDPSTGTMALSFTDVVLDDGVNVAYAGMAFSEFDDFDLFLYDVNGDDDAFHFEVDSYSPRNEILSNILSSFNAGRGDLASTISNVVGIENLDAIQPLRIALRAYPNPFQQNLAIHYDAKVGARVALSVFDLNGRRIRTLADGRSTSPNARVVWDGFDEAGTPAAPGVYFLRLESGHHSITRKVMLMR